MTDTTKLPPLPKPDCSHYGGYTGWELVGQTHSPKQTLSYGSKCWDDGLEAAAKILEAYAAELLGDRNRVPAVDQHVAYVLRDRAKAIRALKESK